MQTEVLRGAEWSPGEEPSPGESVVMLSAGGKKPGGIGKDGAGVMMGIS